MQSSLVRLLLIIGVSIKQIKRVTVKRNKVYDVFVRVKGTVNVIKIMFWSDL